MLALDAGVHQVRVCRGLWSAPLTPITVEAGEELTVTVDRPDARSGSEAGSRWALAIAVSQN